MRPPLLLLCYRLAVLLLVYSLCRLFFLVFNREYFNITTFGEFLIVFLQGVRFDLAAIVLLNSLFIAGHLVPPRLFFKRNYQITLKIIFYLANIPALLFNLIDIGYYRFSLKRSSSDLISMIFKSNDVLFTTPAMVRDYWFLAFIFTGLILITEFLYKRYKAKTKIVQKFNIDLILLNVMFAALLVIAGRGGLQLKPLAIISSVQYAAPGLAPVILNTPFTIIKTITKDELKLPDYFDNEAELKKHFTTKRNYSGDEFKEMNVVVIILESFSAEYSHLLSGYDGYTPFLDSLMKESLYFTKAHANAKKSIEGVPAIVSGLPALMTNPYITSGYTGDELTGLPTILNDKNYTTSFFHGGKNGTMGFDNFSKSAGIKNYYGLNEYPDKNDFDDNWGIYDEPFLQFAAQKLNETQQPFLSFIFTLSSHHPYSIPGEHKGKFKKGTLPIHESIMYTDYSLMQFFHSIKNSKWYDNTLFIITADHTGPGEKPEYLTRMGVYRIPLVFYKGQELKGTNEKPVQQIDIFPSVLDYLNYENDFFSFGQSVFTEEKKYIYNFISNVYQINDEQYFLEFDGSMVLSLHDYKTDPFLTINLKDKLPKKRTELVTGLKAIIQTFNSQMKSQKINRE